MNEIIRPETLTLESDSLTKARALVIASNDDYRTADAFSVGLLALEKAIKADFKPAKDAAFQAHRAITAQEAGHLDKVQEARALLRPKMLAWEAEQKRIEAAAQKAADDKAKKEAEDKALVEASAAEAAGDKSTAQAILEAPVVVESVIIRSTMPKRQTKIPEAWTYRVTNAALIPREFLTEDTLKLGGMARATKGSVKVAGVEFYDKNRAL